MNLEELQKHNPTVWNQRMQEGDELFTDQNINATKTVLDSYINSLKKLGDKPKEEDILEYVKEVVIKLNVLNDEYNYYIETIESEELYEFITGASRLAGLQREEDITEEWRDW